MCRHLALALILVACGGSDATDSDPSGPTPEPPVEEDLRCLAGELPLEDGTCQPAGVDVCAEGFESDDAGGCRPLLPETPCEAGTMALPGETSCREVVPCGAPPWGGVEGDRYVDGAYEGGDEDGTQAKPFTSIQAAHDAASPGDVILVAPGSYLEDVTVTKTIDLRGLCPSLVEIVGTGELLAPLAIHAGASDTRVRGFALRGPQVGLGIWGGSAGIQVEDLWIHDTASRGVVAQDTFGPGDATLRNVLVEDVGEMGIFVAGTQVTVEGVAVRGVTKIATPFPGAGIYLRDNPETGVRGSLHLTDASIEGTQGYGMSVDGGEAVVERALIRDVVPSDGQLGFGFVVQQGTATGTLAVATLRDVVVERSHQLGLLVGGAELTAERLTIRDTRPAAQGGADGFGLAVTKFPATGQPSYASIRASSIAESHRGGAVVLSSTAVMESLWIRDTREDAVGEGEGRGLIVQADLPGERSNVTLVGSIVERSLGFGISIADADATIRSTRVSDVAPRPNDQLFGDGIAGVTEGMTPATISIEQSTVTANSRAAIASFGASVVLGASAVSCSPILLNGEEHLGQPFHFDDRGDNLCGCEALQPDCKIVSQGIAPPTPVAP